MIVLNALLYYLVIIPISLLPFPVLYVLSDVLYLVLYRCSGYRTKVVRHNLQNAFPEKSHAEIKVIEKQFYSHLCDVIVETLKSFTISKKEIRKRMVVLNPELMNSFYDEGRSVLIAGGHYNNWEWTATGLPLQVKHQAVGIYTPLSNVFFERRMQSTRGKFGLLLISVKRIKQFYEDHPDQLTATIFGIDQSPRKAARSYWTTFLNQETGVQYGLEKFAVELNNPVLFGTISKVKRGYYTLHFQVITDTPGDEPYGYIIETATSMVEKQILDQPQYWLWTHRRWKHKRPAGHVNQPEEPLKEK